MVVIVTELLRKAVIAGELGGGNSLRECHGDAGCRRTDGVSPRQLWIIVESSCFVETTIESFVLDNVGCRRHCRGLINTRTHMKSKAIRFVRKTWVQFSLRSIQNELSLTCSQGWINDLIDKHLSKEFLTILEEYHSG